MKIRIFFYHLNEQPPVDATKSNFLTVVCEKTKPSGLAIGQMYQSMVLAIALVSASFDEINSFINHVAVADEAHSRA